MPFFSTLVQSYDNVEPRYDVKTTAIQRRYDVVCVQGELKKWVTEVTASSFPFLLLLLLLLFIYLKLT